MIAITGYNVLHYLLNRRLISYAEIEQDQWSFIEDSFASSQNTNIIARNRSDKMITYFIKQSRSISLPDDPLQLEFDVLEIIHETTAREFVPEFVVVSKGKRNPSRLGYDLGNRVLITKFVEGSVSFLDRLNGLPRRRDSDKRMELTLALGSSLALLHRYLPEKSVIEFYESDRAKRSPELTRIKPFTPWILKLCGQDTERFLASNKLYVEKFGLFVREKSTMETLAKLSKSFHTSQKCLINTDARLANVVVVPSIVSGISSKMVFVDWEQAGYGPGYWQLAGFIANFLSFSVYENPPLSETEIVEHIAQLLKGYFGRRPQDKVCILVIQYAGLILLQEFFDWATSEFPSSDSKHADKFLIGAACLQNPLDVIEKPTLGNFRELLIEKFV